MRLLSLDIETAHPHDSYQIISIAVAAGLSGNHKSWVDSWQSHSNEKSLLRSFVRRFNEFDPDVVFTWRGGKFDLPRIQGRLDLHSISTNLGRRSGRIICFPINKPHPFEDNEWLSEIPGRSHVDLALWAECNDQIVRFLDGQRPSLKRVGSLLNMNPIELDTSDMLKHSIKDLKHYNESDAVVTYKIGKLFLQEKLLPT